MSEGRSRVRFGQLREVVADLRTGGVVIHDRFIELPELAEFAVERELGDDQVAFRTLVQLDGDLCTSIHAAALHAPNFLGACDRHLGHVTAVLDDQVHALSRLAKRIGQGSFVAGLAISYGSSLRLDWAGDLVAGVEAQLLAWHRVALIQLVQLAAALVFGALIGVLARWIIRRMLREL